MESPRVQNGLTLVTHHTGRQQSAPRTPTRTFFQWINAHLFPTGSYVTDMEMPCLEIALPKGTTTGQFPATARASTGDVFPLSCDDWMATGNSAQSRAPHTFVRLPNVPATYQWLDVTVKDKKGHAGTWRITKLPHLKHALSPTAPLHETETVKRIPLEARAWWDPKGTRTNLQGEFGNEALPIVAEIRGVVPQTALALPSHSWTVSIDGLTQEWEPASRPLPFVRGKNSISGFSMGSSGYSISGPTGLVTTASATAASAPHPGVQTRAKIDATLTLRDSHDESVTFHNIPLEKNGRGLRVRAGSGGIVLSTPSGVRVRLLPQRSPASFGSPAGSNNVDITAVVSPENGLVPGSPLQKRAGKQPLQVSCHIPFSGGDLIGMMSNNKNDRLTYKKRLPRPVLPELTVNVTQTAELKSFPVQFTVPVRAGKPKTRWSN